VANRQILHYQIERKLGEGGMGEVFLADDLRLHRKVALKFLPESLSADPAARERLLREAQAASKLSHPNILTIHAIENADGRDFIVMEYVEGESLSDYGRRRNCSVDEVLQLAVQIGEGLKKAHEAGIVHRDLKPGNILVDRDGRPRILDFGLAKLEGAAKLTQTGSTLGTMAYISPEQAQGREVDMRADLFSFGVLLYEMLTGRLPFRGDHEAALIYAIVNEEPEPLARFKAGVPDEVSRIVMKALAKRPEERYQSAADMAADLRAQLRHSQAAGPAARHAVSDRKGFPWLRVAALVVAIGAVGAFFLPRMIDHRQAEVKAGPTKVAVLPFQNLGSPDDEYFADGITEEIIARLASVSGLGVIARTSVIGYKGTQKPITEIARELGVDYILEGTIRWQKSPGGTDRVRITPQLVRTSDATHTWAQVYDEELTEVFQVQSDVASKVVEAMNVTLLEPERARLSSKHTADLKAYDYFLRGNEYFNQIRGGINEKALQLAGQLYEQAIAADSGFVAAWARLSRVYTELYWHTTGDSLDRAKARQYVDRALELNAEDADARTALGSLFYHEGDFDRALTELTIARRLQPNNADVLMEIAYVHRRQGKGEQCLEEMQAAIELDPQSVGNANQVIGTALWMHRFDLADAFYRRAVSLAPDNADVYANRAQGILMQSGDVSSALAVFEGADGLVENSYAYIDIRIACEVAAGNYAAAISYLERNTLRRPGRHDIRMADLYAFSGKPDLARRMYDSARMTLEREVNSPDEMHNPDASANAYADLAVVYASLGMKARAMESVQNAFDRLTSEYGRWECEAALARVHALSGEPDSACAILERLVKGPSFVTEHTVRLHPAWAPLRNNPRFQKLVAGAGPAS
jgi:TolB-like protein/Tfp pilus assembly protein PilF/predicted Ser/Thr protein kinase